MTGVLRLNCASEFQNLFWNYKTNLNIFANFAIINLFTTTKHPDPNPTCAIGKRRKHESLERGGGTFTSLQATDWFPFSGSNTVLQLSVTNISGLSSSRHSPYSRVCDVAMWCNDGAMCASNVRPMVAMVSMLLSCWIGASCVPSHSHLLLYRPPPTVTCFCIFPVFFLFFCMFHSSSFSPNEYVR